MNRSGLNRHQNQEPISAVEETSDQVSEKTIAMENLEDHVEAEEVAHTEEKPSTPPAGQQSAYLSEGPGLSESEEDEDDPELLDLLKGEETEDDEMSG